MSWRYSMVQYYPIKVICHIEYHLHSTLCRVHFLWTKRTVMLSFIWLAFQVWFIKASPGFVHSDYSSKKVVTYPLVTVQQGLSNCIAMPLWHLWNFIGYPVRLQVSGNPECRAECGAHFCDILGYLLLTHMQSISNLDPREARSWTVLFSTWGHPVWRLSWTASLTSHNALTHCPIVQYGNAAITTCFTQSLIIFLWTTTSCHFNFDPGILL